MVRAILAGTKTQTRRVIKPQPHQSEYDAGGGLQGGFRGTPGWFWCGGTKKDPTDFSWEENEVPTIEPRNCPHGKPGDRLWVRETWGRTKGNGIRTVYRADGEEPKELLTDRCVKGMKWSSPIHMPRWASRITLEIVGVRVERLQEISEEDAKAEGPQPGFIPFGLPLPKNPTVRDLDRILNPPGMLSFKKGFQFLWESINTKPGTAWEYNPWVWCIEFKRVEV